MQQSLFDIAPTDSLPVEATPLDQRIYGLLQQHHGRRAAISMDSLANLCQVSTREIQDAIANMVIAYRIPIGSTSSADRSGYYLIADRAEAAVVYASLKGRALAILKRASVIGKISSADLLREIQSEFDLNVRSS